MLMCAAWDGKSIKALYILIDRKMNFADSIRLSVQYYPKVRTLVFPDLRTRWLPFPGNQHQYQGGFRSVHSPSVELSRESSVFCRRKLWIMCHFSLFLFLILFGVLMSHVSCFMPTRLKLLQKNWKLTMKVGKFKVKSRQGKQARKRSPQ